MNRIAVVTTTRAEYGLLSPVIRELRKYESDFLKVDLIVTGTHLSEEYGMTVNEICEKVNVVIPVSVKSRTELDISKNQAEVLIKFTEFFMKEKYSGVLLLGDRYETLAVAIAAGNTRTPVFHLCGGDTTEGALDEWIRHAITKISYIHYVTNEESLARVIQLGENPVRVFNFGSTSIDNILAVANMTKADALRSIGLENCAYAICTYHPVTMEADNVEDQLHEVLDVIQMFPEIEFIVTKSNADQGGARINELLDHAERIIPNIHVFTSLGTRRYLSLMKYSEFVMGNSSSGIIEAPALHVPTINIGDRQKGRLQTGSIINCGTSKDEISDAIKIALSEKHKALCRNVASPYGDGKSAERIAKKTVEIVNRGRIDLKKSFFDLNKK